ncbi:hypothetical protein C8J56DRAFT_884295 [Mycena floridula]|nr:hypothetical protein C8J56DRAFT_884295 [Mycena floridula]
MLTILAWIWSYSVLRTGARLWTSVSKRKMKGQRKREERARVCERVVRLDGICENIFLLLLIIGIAELGTYDPTDIDQSQLGLVGSRDRPPPPLDPVPPAAGRQFNSSDLGVVLHPSSCCKLERILD